MDSVHHCCAGIDIHKCTIAVCALFRDEHGRAHREDTTFATHTADLQRAKDWLHERHITHVAMESTGVYWQPVYEVLEGSFELIVVNPTLIKGLIGRKTDRADAKWIAQLLQQDLLPASFIPSAQQRCLRQLTRSRARLVQERARFILRMHKVLEQAHIKLGSVVSDLMGVSARDILTALLDGERDPAVLAAFARGRLRRKRAELAQALEGRFLPHHRFLIGEYLTLIDALDESIALHSQEISLLLSEQEDLLARLQTIPGIGLRLAEVIVAEIGTDLSRFPSAKHLASWAGMCPGNNESAGKRLHGRIRPANSWLRSALTEAAHGASHTKNTYLSAQYHRLVGRLGAKKTAIALGHTLLIIIYHVITEQTTYRELGSNFYDEHDRQRVQHRLVRRLEQLGYAVVLTPEQPEAV